MTDQIQQVNTRRQTILKGLTQYFSIAKEGQNQKNGRLAKIKNFKNKKEINDQESQDKSTTSELQSINNLEQQIGPSQFSHEAVVVKESPNLDTQLLTIGSTDTDFTFKPNNIDYEVDSIRTDRCLDTTQSLRNVDSHQAANTEQTVTSGGVPSSEEQDMSINEFCHDKIFISTVSFDASSCSANEQLIAAPSPDCISRKQIQKETPPEGNFYMKTKPWQKQKQTISNYQQYGDTQDPFHVALSDFLNWVHSETNVEQLVSPRPGIQDQQQQANNFTSISSQIEGYTTQKRNKQLQSFEMDSTQSLAQYPPQTAMLDMITSPSYSQTSGNTEDQKLTAKGGLDRVNYVSKLHCSSLLKQQQDIKPSMKVPALSLQTLNCAPYSSRQSQCYNRQIVSCPMNGSYGMKDAATGLQLSQETIAKQQLQTIRTFRKPPLLGQNSIKQLSNQKNTPFQGQCLKAQLQNTLNVKASDCARMFASNGQSKTIVCAALQQSQLHDHLQQSRRYYQIQSESGGLSRVPYSDDEFLRPPIKKELGQNSTSPQQVLDSFLTSTSGISFYSATQNSICTTFLDENVDRLCNIDEDQETIDQDEPSQTSMKDTFKTQDMQDLFVKYVEDLKCAKDMFMDLQPGVTCQR